VAPEELIGRVWERQPRATVEQAERRRASPAVVDQSRNSIEQRVVVHVADDMNVWRAVKSSGSG